jgi:hypothetical protein
MPDSLNRKRDMKINKPIGFPLGLVWRISLVPAPLGEG